MKTVLSTAGTLLAALLASACCWAPALLGASAAGSLGFSAALAPYRTALLVVAGLFLVGGFVVVYRRPKEDCCDTPAASRNRKRNIGLMWTVAVLSIAAAAYPNVLEARASVPLASAVPAQGRVVTLALAGLDCAGCAGPVKRRLSAVPGVSSARVDFARREASVTVVHSVPMAALVDAVKAAGFKATVKERR